MRNGLGQDFRKGPNGCPPPKNPCPCPGCRKRLGLGQGHFEFKSPIWMPPPEKLWQILAKKGILIYNNAIKPAIFHKNLSCQTKKRKILLYSIPLYYYFFFGGGAYNYVYRFEKVLVQVRVILSEMDTDKVSQTTNLHLL